jgi:glycine/D-amino acid oxidase-like deaminating enzyme
MGTESTTAQVTPAEFTRSMMDLAQEKGAKLTIASAESLEFEAGGVTPKRVRAVNEKGEGIEIPATDIVIAAGPWTARLASKLLGTRAGAALDVEPRFVMAFPAPRSSLPAGLCPIQRVLNLCRVPALSSGHSTRALHRAHPPLWRNSLA